MSEWEKLYREAEADRDRLAAELGMAKIANQVLVKEHKKERDKLLAERDALKLTGRKLNPVIRERDALTAERDELIRRLEPSEPTYESALGEIDYLHDLEQMVGKDAIANQTLRRANETLRGALSSVREKVIEHAKAYAPDIFTPLEKDEIEEHSTLITRNSAAMGRHMCICFLRYIDEALATAGGANERGE